MPLMEFIKIRYRQCYLLIIHDSRWGAVENLLNGLLGSQFSVLMTSCFTGALKTDVSMSVLPADSEDAWSDSWPHSDATFKRARDGHVCIGDVEQHCRRGEKKSLSLLNESEYVKRNGRVLDRVNAEAKYGDNIPGVYRMSFDAHNDTWTKDYCPREDITLAVYQERFERLRTTPARRTTDRLTRVPSIDDGSGQRNEEEYFPTLNEWRCRRRQHEWLFKGGSKNLTTYPRGKIWSNSLLYGLIKSHARKRNRRGVAIGAHQPPSLLDQNHGSCLELHTPDEIEALCHQDGRDSDEGNSFQADEDREKFYSLWTRIRRSRLFSRPLFGSKGNPFEKQHRYLAAMVVERGLSKETSLQRTDSIASRLQDSRSCDIYGRAPDRSQPESLLVYQISV